MVIWQSRLETCGELVGKKRKESGSQARRLPRDLKKNNSKRTRRLGKRPPWGGIARYIFSRV